MRSASSGPGGCLCRHQPRRHPLDPRRQRLDCRSAGRFRLRPARLVDLCSGLGKLVCNQQAGHHQQPFLAQLPDGGNKLLDTLIDKFGKIRQMIFLPVLTGNPVRTVIDTNLDLRHAQPLPCVDVENRPQTIDRRIETLRDFGIAGLKAFAALTQSGKFALDLRRGARSRHALSRLLEPLQRLTKSEFCIFELSHRAEHRMPPGKASTKGARGRQDTAAERPLLVWVNGTWHTLPMADPFSPPTKSGRPVIVRGIDDARLVCRAAQAGNVPVALWSPPFGAAQMGPLWFQRIGVLIAEEFPELAVDMVLDCGDSPGHAMAALRQGIDAIALTARPAVRRKIEALGKRVGTRLVRRPTRIFDPAAIGNDPDSLHRWLVRRNR